MAHSRAERGRLRQTSSSRECASLAGRAFLCTREFQRNFLVYTKQAHLPVTEKYACFYISLTYFIRFHSLAMLMYAVLLCYCLKCLIQIFNDIVNVLSTDRKTDGVRVDALLFQLFFCQLCMSSRSWVDNQRLNICYVCK